VTANVAVGIITYNSAPYLQRCLEAVCAQSTQPAEILVWDNGSSDTSAALARGFGVPVVLAGRNLGFAAAANEIIRRTVARCVLLLNPDAYPCPDYLARLERVADADPEIGSVTGKLLRVSSGKGPPTLDSTGHVLYRNRSALNRGENETDRGQYDAPGEVFGVCAAAALYRRTMLEDVRVGPDYFDPAFFAYLEDVDLDWRARIRGWKAYYEPSAVAFHERGHPGKRGTRNATLLRHSLKNRYLMVLRNDRLPDLVRDAPAMLAMEAMRFVDYALTHPTALRGYLDLLPVIQHAFAARREIQRRRRVLPAAMRPWFQPYPFRRKLREILLGTI
jgi:GT2 family glycosyltransferase